MLPLRRSLSRIGCVALATSATFFVCATPSLAATPIALGANIANAPDQLAPMQSYASLVGRNPAIIMWYQQWSEPLFWSTQLPNTQAMGAIPLITWDPIYDGDGIPLSSIVSGKYDAYIKASAQAAAAWRQPILIRFGHEMNLPGSVFGPGHAGDTPATFVAAWRHVVTIFREQGATNVEWVWSPNTDCAGKCPFTAYFPGSTWVDWVALDGYNYSSVDHIPWYTFDQIFSSSYAELTSLSNKPVMVAETASTELGGNKAQWITQAFANLPNEYPRIHAVVWFERDKETDWRVESSPSSLAAWQAVVASPAYSGTAATVLAAAPTSHDVDSVGAPATALASGAGAASSAGPAMSAASRQHKKSKHHQRRHRARRRHGRRTGPVEYFVKASRVRLG